METLAKQYQENASNSGDEATKPTKRQNADFDILTKHLTKAFGVPVKLNCNSSGKGKITFAFNNDEDLDRIITIFDRLKD